MFETIQHAAVLRTDNCIIFGKSHADCIARSPKQTCPTRRQGFLTNKFRFVLRKEAAQIALKAGQIKEIKLAIGLLSEHLWGRDGQYDYDPEYGYRRRNT